MLIVAGWQRLQKALETDWQPYLDRKVDLKTAMRNLVRDASESDHKLYAIFLTTLPKPRRDAPMPVARRARAVLPGSILGKTGPCDFPFVRHMLFSKIPAPCFHLSRRGSHLCLQHQSQLRSRAASVKAFGLS